MRREEHTHSLHGVVCLPNSSMDILLRRIPRRTLDILLWTIPGC